MKPFNLEEAKAGKPVCTRDGDKTRIVCFDFKNENYPIVALILIDDRERVITYSKEGKYYCNSDDQNDNDLMMADIIHEGYMNLYKNEENIVSGSIIYETEEKAKNCARDAYYLDTIKIQWKE